MKGPIFRRPLACCLLLLLAVLLPSPSAPAKPPKLLDLADAVAANPILTKFSLMIQASDLGTFLSSRGPFTLFAPTDSAFSSLPPGVLDTLLRPENKERLQHIVLYHLVNGKKLSAKDIKGLTSIVSCDDVALNFKTTKSGTQFVQKAKIVHAEIRCQNGFITEIDSLLMPPESTLPPIAPPPPSAPITNAAPVAIPLDTNVPPFDPTQPKPSTGAPPHE